MPFFHPGLWTFCVTLAVLPRESPRVSLVKGHGPVSLEWERDLESEFL